MKVSVLLGVIAAIMIAVGSFGSFDGHQNVSGAGGVILVMAFVVGWLESRSHS